MDKIKENLFGIGVGVLVVLLAVFLYFWTLAPVFSEIGSVEGRLSTQRRELSGFEKQTPFPTDDYVAYREKRQSEIDGAVQLGEDFYAKRKEFFDQLFPEFPALPPPGDFRALFSTRIQELKTAYLDKFPREVEQDPRSKEPIDPASTLQLEERTVNTAEDVPVAMKHFWIIEDVFNSLTELELGGLRSVTFPRPGRDSIEPPATYDVIRAEVTVEMPLSRVGALLERLFASTRVPFIDVERLEVTRAPESVRTDLVIQKDYQKPQDAEADREGAVGPEPPVMATLLLQAMDWKGLPEETEEGDK